MGIFRIRKNNFYLGESCKLERIQRNKKIWQQNFCDESIFLLYPMEKKPKRKME